MKRKKALRQIRIFSEAVKKKIVHDIEKGKCSVTEASQELLVRACKKITYTF